MNANILKMLCPPEFMQEFTPQILGLMGLRVYQITPSIISEVKCLDWNFRPECLCILVILQGERKEDYTAGPTCSCHDVSWPAWPFTSLCHAV